jgi:hypothetical protein
MLRTIDTCILYIAALFEKNYVQHISVILKTTIYNHNNYFNAFCCGFVAIGQSENSLQNTEQLLYNGLERCKGLKLDFRVYHSGPT